MSDRRPWPRTDYRGYIIEERRSDLFDVVQPQLGRHGSLGQAHRAIDHFLDRDCSAHGGKC